MNDKNIDTELIKSICIEILEKFRLMTAAIPEKHENLLKHINGSIIHIMLFQRECNDLSGGKKIHFDKKMDNLVDEFISTYLDHGYGEKY